MKNRRAIVFFLAWSALFAIAIALLSNSGRPDADSAFGSISGLDVRNVVRVDVDRRGGDGAGGDSISVVKSNGRWRLSSPFSAEADEDAVKRLVDAIVFAEPGDALSEADMAALGRSLRDFGLCPPKCTATVFADNVRETFFVGRTTAAGNEVYVCRAGRKCVFTVSAKLTGELTRPIGEFRRRRLFMFRPSDVAGMGLKDDGEPLTRVAKSDGVWRIADPVNAPADRQVVEELIADLCSAQIMDYAAGEGGGRRLGDGEGFAISLRDTFGAVEKIVFGNPDGTNAVWALTPEGVEVRVGLDLFERCKSRRKKLEDTRIFPSEASLVTSLSLSEGFPAYVIARQSPSAPWMMISPINALADGKTVESILSKVLSLRGAGLVPEGSDGAMMVTVGTSVTNFSARYVCGSAMMQDVRLSDLLGKTMFRCDRGSVRKILVKTSAGDSWNAAGSEEVLSLLSAGIEAERVEAVALKTEDFALFGFDHPACTISFELDDEASSLRRMLVGSVAPDGGRYAIIGGSDAAFVLPASVVSILVKPVETTMEN